MTEMESITETEEFKEGIKKVGPGSKFYYRCIFDPTPVIDDNKSESVHD